MLIPISHEAAVSEALWYLKTNPHSIRRTNQLDLAKNFFNLLWQISKAMYMCNQYICASLWEIFLRWALDYFDVYACNNHRPALWVVQDGGAETQLTFAALRERSNRVANFLRQTGVRRGDRMLVML